MAEAKIKPKAVIAKQEVETLDPNLVILTAAALTGLLANKAMNISDSHKAVRYARAALDELNK